MADNDGTFSRLIEMAKERPPAPSPPPANKPSPPPDPAPEDISTIPYISQNYRFTEQELRWLRRQSYDLSADLGMKVSQNTVLRVALHHLRAICESTPATNPLLDAILKLKK